MPLMFRAVWKSAVFFKVFLKESDCENASNNFCSIFFCIYIYIYTSLRDSYQQQKQRLETHRFVETYQNPTELPIKSKF